WSKVPSEVKYIATDADGYGFGYFRKPELNKFKEGFGKNRDVANFMISPKKNPFVDYSNGWNWKDSLEKRPELKEPSHG
ncbi:hypothetical protein ACV0NA_003724, partial [Acinetobacter baumannii]